MREILDSDQRLVILRSLLNAVTARTNPCCKPALRHMGTAHPVMWYARIWPGWRSSDLSACAMWPDVMSRRSPVAVTMWPTAGPSCLVSKSQGHGGNDGETKSIARCGA